MKTYFCKFTHRENILSMVYHSFNTIYLATVLQVGGQCEGGRSVSFDKIKRTVVAMRPIISTV